VAAHAGVARARIVLLLTPGIKLTEHSSRARRLLQYWYLADLIPLV
jgi:hypothetical protein